MADTRKSHDLLRNAAIALAIIPLFDNIDQSLEKEWNNETFDETDRAMNKFIADLEKLGYAITPLVDPEEVFKRTGEALDDVKTDIFGSKAYEGPIQ